MFSMYSMYIPRTDCFEKGGQKKKKKCHIISYSLPYADGLRIPLQTPRALCVYITRATSRFGGDTHTPQPAMISARSRMQEPLPALARTCALAAALTTDNNLDGRLRLSV